MNKSETVVKSVSLLLIALTEAFIIYMALTDPTQTTTAAKLSPSLVALYALFKLIPRAKNLSRLFKEKDYSMLKEYYKNSFTGAYLLFFSCSVTYLAFQAASYFTTGHLLA